MTAARLQMEGVRKAFGATVALAGVDLKVAPGSVHALIGENGAGKSTLMKVLSGAHQPDTGRMWLDGTPYRPTTPRDGRQAGVAMIYQELSLAPHLSVMENILLGIEPTTGRILRWTEMRRRATEALAQVGRSDIHPATAVARLGIADRQLVEIARSVAVGCRVLVLDEPTSSLTGRDIERLFALIRRLKGDGIAVIYISHFLEEIQQISDTYTVLRDGMTVSTGSTAASNIGTLVQQMVGRTVDRLYPRSTRAPGEVLLRAEEIAREDKLVRASIELHRGEVLGIAGLVGAGRTELLRALFGLDPVEHGHVRIGKYSRSTPTQMWQRGAGFVSEDRKSEGLALNLSLADNITLAELGMRGAWGVSWPARERRSARRWIDSLHIRARSPLQAVQTLSGGNQQKIALARLLHADVDVLLLDEPTRGIDIGSKSQIYQLIDRCVSAESNDGRQRKAILMVSSYLPELLGMCDRIAVMCRGVLGEPRPVAEWSEHEIMIQATGLGGAA